MAQHTRSTQSLTHSTSAMGPMLQDSPIIGGTADLYTRTSASLGRNVLDPAEIPDHQAKARPTEMGQIFGWENAEFNLSTHLYGGEAMGNTQFPGLYEDDFIGRELGFFAPFETATQDDMLNAVNFAGDKAQQNIFSFGTQQF